MPFQRSRIYQFWMSIGSAWEWLTTSSRGLCFRICFLVLLLPNISGTVVYLSLTAAPMICSCVRYCNLYVRWLETVIKIKTKDATFCILMGLYHTYWILGSCEWSVLPNSPGSWFKIHYTVTVMWLWGSSVSWSTGYPFVIMISYLGTAEAFVRTYKKCLCTLSSELLFCSSPCLVFFLQVTLS